MVRERKKSYMAYIYEKKKNRTTVFFQPEMIFFRFVKKALFDLSVDVRLRYRAPSVTSVSFQITCTLMFIHNIRSSFFFIISIYYRNSFGDPLANHFHLNCQELMAELINCRKHVDFLH